MSVFVILLYYVVNAFELFIQCNRFGLSRINNKNHILDIIIRWLIIRVIMFNDRLR